MRVHYFQHVPFEGLGHISTWLDSVDAAVAGTKLYETSRFPKMDDFEMLIVMGGPMSVNDERVLPWLMDEKKLIRQSIEKGKVVLGVCLGAQLIANALGARVHPNPDREIGWFPIYDAGLVRENSQFRFPKEILAFHWHGETFELPVEATLLARSEGCEHQAFQIGRRVMGLQFHFETTPASVLALTKHCAGDLAPGRYVQSAKSILEVESERYAIIHGLMNQILYYLLKGY